MRRCQIRTGRGEIFSRAQDEGFKRGLATTTTAAPLERGDRSLESMRRRIHCCFPMGELAAQKEKTALAEELRGRELNA